MNNLQMYVLKKLDYVLISVSMQAEKAFKLCLNEQMIRHMLFLFVFSSSYNGLKLAGKVFYQS